MNSDLETPTQNNLTQFGFDPGSPLNNNNRPQTPGMQFDTQYEVQKSIMRYSGLVGTSLLTTASGNVGTASTSVVSVTLTPTLQQNMNMGIPFIAIYEGTSINSSLQIFPTIGGSIAGNKFICWGGFDYQVWSTNSKYPSPTPYAVSVYNNNGGTTANLYVVVQWKFTANNTGGQT